MGDWGRRWSRLFRSQHRPPLRLQIQPSGGRGSPDRTAPDLAAVGYSRRPWSSHRICPRPRPRLRLQLRRPKQAPEWLFEVRGRHLLRRSIALPPSPSNSSPPPLSAARSGLFEVRGCGGDYSVVSNFDEGLLIHSAVTSLAIL